MELKVYAGGRFTYQRQFQRLGLADVTTTARGRWHCSLEDGDQVLSLSGTAKVLKGQPRHGRHRRSGGRHGVFLGFSEVE